MSPSLAEPIQDSLAGLEGSDPGAPRRRADRAPLLSVLVTAHQRREFLPEALRSIERQDLPSDQYEVVVVKDYADAAIDLQIEELGGRTVPVEGDNMGGIMALGIRACRGDVICFLDDDDRFAPHKLRVVRDEFLRFPDLGYLHNGLTLIDEGGNHLDGLSPEYRDRAERMSRDPDFCSSCISIRSDFFRPLVVRWSEVRRAPDTLLDYVARAAGFTRRSSTEPLTEYRIHPSSNSRRTNHAPAYFAIAQVLRALPASPSRDSAVSSLLGRYMSAAIRGRSSDRRSAVWAALHLAAGVRLNEVRPNAREIACGALIPLSPGAARRIYQTLCGGQVEWLPQA